MIIRLKAGDQSMHKYLVLLKTTYKSIINYKASMVILILQALIQFSVMLFLWQAVFRESPAVNGYQFHEIVAYYFGVTLLSYFCFFAIDWEINQDIHSGQFGQVLLKPCSLLTYYFVKMLGNRLATLIFAVFPLGLIGCFIFRNTPYNFTMITGVFTLLTIFLAMVLWFFLAFSVAMLAFWLENIFFILTVKEILVEFFAGMLIPISFFPKSIQQILLFLPFRYLAYEPLQIINGLYASQQAIKILVIQLMWILALFGLAKGLLKLGLKHYTNVSG